MTEDPFLSSRMKLQRAKAHFDDLERAMGTYLANLRNEGKNLVSIDQYYWARGHCILFLVTHVEPPDPQWGILVGDILHNLNAALDHVAWSVVTLGRTPPDTLTESQRERIYFPLLRERPNKKKPWPQRVRKCLPGVGVTERTVIRAYQPFMVPKRKRRLHTLALMRQFANYDKHRVVQPIYYRAYETVVEVGESRDFSIGRVVSPKPPIPMEPGAELLRIYGRRDGPNPYVEVQIGGAPQPALEGRNLAGRSPPGTRHHHYADH